MDGIHAAYRSREFGYDWLPLYLYVSKAAGLIYQLSGLANLFGTYSHVLTILLKFIMTGFHLLTVFLVFRICQSLKMTVRMTNLVTAGVGLSPGTLLATAAFGYQDAFHTLIVATALYSVVRNRLLFSSVLTVAAALTKPQAVIFLGPFWLLVLIKRDFNLLLKCFAGSCVAILAILSPFIVYGTLTDVWEMYWEIPHYHRWLTGCAHNVWWLFAPVPPFSNDRVLILPGLNGLRIGILAFASFCGLTAFRILSDRVPRSIVSSSAFLAFAFFMVVTEIHENHLYACFVFLGIAAGMDRRLWLVFWILSVTFSADLVLTLYLLRTDVPIVLGSLRLSSLNAVINVSVLILWTFYVVRDLTAVGVSARTADRE